MRTKYIDHGFFLISRADALRLCGTLPRHGYEKLVNWHFTDFWVSRVCHQGQLVWTIRTCDPKKAYKVCEGCTGLMLDLNYAVCWECTKARHNAVLSRKCVCRKIDRKEKLCQTGSRQWLACQRCLGVIKQLS